MNSILSIDATYFLNITKRIFSRIDLFSKKESAGGT